LQEASRGIRGRFNELPQEAPYYGMIHGDVIRANAQVADDGAVTILDFDLCGPGWRAYDVASYQQVAGTKEARRAFIEGYQAVRELSARELALLPVFEAARHIFSLGIPASNVHGWGKTCITDTIISGSLDGLRRCMASIA
jgi:Ser/Thr protein kinase RdoA (MazF antagonist)